MEKFLGTLRVQKNYVPSSHIYGGPHHKCEKKDHHSLYSENT